MYVLVCQIISSLSLNILEVSGKDDNQFTFKGHLHTFEPFVQNIKWGLSGNQNAKSYAELRCISLENNKNYCQSNPCTNNSTCYNGITSYYCDCNCGWKGRTCNISKLIPGYEKHMWLVPPKKNDCIFSFQGRKLNLIVNWNATHTYYLVKMKLVNHHI